MAKVRIIGTYQPAAAPKHGTNTRIDARAKIGFFLLMLIAVLAAEGAAVLRLRSLVNGWEKDVEDGDKVLTDEEVRTVERLGRQMSALGIAAIVLFVLRFVLFALLPMLRG